VSVPLDLERPFKRWHEGHLQLWEALRFTYGGGGSYSEREARYQREVIKRWIRLKLKTVTKRQRTKFNDLFKGKRYFDASIESNRIVHTVINWSYSDREAAYPFYLKRDEIVKRRISAIERFQLSQLLEPFVAELNHIDILRSRVEYRLRRQYECDRPVQ
jgi:hypothetical protein